MIAVAPAWLFEKSLPVERVKGEVPNDLFAPCSEGGRNMALTRLAGLLLNTNSLEKTKAISRLWNAQNSQPLPDEELEKTVLSVYQKVQKSESQDVARTLTLVRGDAIKIEPTEWAYTGRIPKNDIALITGDPDLGKSMITHDLAARWSRGQLPGVYKDIPVTVLLASAEDSPSHTIMPRFTAAGGDPTKLHIIKTHVGGYDGGGLKLPDDLPLLVDEAKRVDAKILIIDPLMSHLANELNSNSDQHIRQALGVLPEFAAEHDITFLIVCHLNKNQGASAQYRIGGSVGIFAVPRSVLLAGPDPDDEEKKVLVHIKCNLGEKAPALSYSLERKITHDANGKPVETGGVVWHGEKDGITAESVLGNKRDPEAQSALDEAKTWLWGYLESGEVETKSCLIEARKNGHSERTTKRARSAIGANSTKIGFGTTSYWVWALPPEEGQTPREGGHTQDLGTLSQNIGENGQKPQQNHEEGQDQGVAPLVGTLSSQDCLIPEFSDDREVNPWT